MLIQYHVLLSALIAAFLAPFYGWWALIAFFTGFLIDVDHYIYYVFRFKKFNLVKCYKYFITHHRNHILIFHTIEFNIILVLLALFVHNIFILMLFGTIPHFILDVLSSISRKTEFRSRIFCFSYWVIKK